MSTALFFYYFKAGIASPDNKDQLIIALEPEGAAIFCRERKMEDFADQTGDACIYDVVYRPGLRYLMMDIGGIVYSHRQYHELGQNQTLLYSMQMQIGKVKAKPHSGQNDSHCRSLSHFP